MSTTITIQTFFSNKTLIIPAYQRDYAWSTSNAEDLLDDIDEALNGHIDHYLGTFILARQSGTTSLCVVDGQQRLTTLTMLLHSLVSALNNSPIGTHYHNIFIHDPIIGADKFSMGGATGSFFRAMLVGSPCTPATEGEQRLIAVYDWIKRRVNNLSQTYGDQRIRDWLNCIGSLQVLEFIEPNEGKAIRMFQSVNDRGVPLCTMDVVKSLLIYHSNCYLNGALDAHVATEFGKAFRSFAKIKTLAGKPGYTVKHINRKTFTEDDILRYHYCAFDDSAFHGGAAADDAKAGADFNATSERVLNQYLKPLLSKLRSTPSALDKFIREYTEDLVRFFKGLEDLLDSSATNKPTYLLFVAHDVSATLYPLLIQLHIKGWLALTPQAEVPGAPDPRTVLDFIELADMRVFKIRGTNPQVDIATITRMSHTWTPLEVTQKLLSFCRKWMPDTRMKSILTDNDMFRHAALHPILLAWEDDSHFKNSHLALTVADLEVPNKNGLSIEHIHPQTHCHFNVGNHQFSDTSDYEDHNNLLGNLLLLESSINSSCGNDEVTLKVATSGPYLGSSLSSVKDFAVSWAQPNNHTKNDLINRSGVLADFAINKWHIY